MRGRFKKPVAQEPKPKRVPKPKVPSVPQEVCTAERPMPPDATGRHWAHPDAISKFAGTYFKLAECPHCRREIIG